MTTATTSPQNAEEKPSQEKPNLDTSPATASTAPPAKVRKEISPRMWVLSSASLIVGGLLLGLVFNLLLFSPLRHARDQQVSYASFRSDLAYAIAPIGSTANTGGLVPLGAPVALLQIPALGINEVVLEGSTSVVLMSGPGHMRNSVLPGQVGHSVVMGRATSFGGPFSAIGDLQPGTEFTAVTGQGEHTYKVTAIRLNGEKPTALAPGEGRLTLVTAAGSPYLPSGLVQVDAVLTSDSAARTDAVPSAAYMSPAEAPLAGDNSAAVGLLLWSALLLGAAVLLVWMSTRWGTWQTWVVAVPVVTALGVAVTNHIIMFLPNLI